MCLNINDADFLYFSTQKCTPVGIVTGHGLLARHASHFSIPINQFCKSCKHLNKKDTQHWQLLLGTLGASRMLL